MKGEQIRIFRSIQKMSQAELARQTGIPKCTMCLIENGYRGKPEDIRKIEQVLHIELEDDK